MVSDRVRFLRYAVELLSSLLSRFLSVPIINLLRSNSRFSALTRRVCRAVANAIRRSNIFARTEYHGGSRNLSHKNMTKELEISRFQYFLALVWTRLSLRLFFLYPALWVVCFVIVFDLYWLFRVTYSIPFI